MMSRRIGSASHNTSKKCCCCSCCCNISMAMIDRILLVTWLLKDFGWMTLDVAMGWTFGFCSVAIHFFLLFFDTRRSFRFYNISLLLWVCGNFIWMSLEFLSEKPSSHVHVGPTTPIGHLSPQLEDHLTTLKTILFLLSSSIQILMYIFIFNRCIPTPEDEGEDIMSKNEAVLFFFGQKSFYSKQSQSTEAMDNVDIDEDDDLTLTDPNNAKGNPFYSITLALIENAYVIFWVSKDLFWSWGTGDLTKGQNLAVMYEICAMTFGSLSILTYVLTAYLYRRNLVRLLDCITTIFWISANYVWMCGEFFLRYDNLKYNDDDEGDDSLTRVISSILFCCGILLQLYVIIALYLPANRYTRCLHDHVHNQHKTRSSVEMAHIREPIGYNNIMVSFAPQQVGLNPIMAAHPQANTTGRSIHSEGDHLHAFDNSNTNNNNHLFSLFDDEETVLF